MQPYNLYRYAYIVKLLILKKHIRGITVPVDNFSTNELDDISKLIEFRIKYDDN